MVSWCDMEMCKPILQPVQVLYNDEMRRASTVYIKELSVDKEQKRAESMFLMVTETAKGSVLPCPCNAECSVKQL